MRPRIRYLLSIIVIGMWCGICISPLSAEGQNDRTPSADKTYRIGLLLYRGETDAERGFRQYLQQKGLKAEYLVRDAAENPKQLPALVEEMRAMKLDLIYTFGTTATIAVVGKTGQATPVGAITDVPVVFNIVADPVGSGITQSLNGSDRNVTGVSHLVPIGSQLSALRAAMNCRRVAVIYSANEKNAVLSADALVSAASHYDLSIVRYPLGNGASAGDLKELDALLDRVVADRPDVVYVPSDSFMIKHANVLGQRLKEARIPSMSATESPIRKGGLVMGLVSPYFNAGAFAGHKAYQILAENRNPGVLPISGLDKFTFLINMRAALAIGFYPKIGALGFAEVIGLPQRP